MRPEGAGRAVRFPATVDIDASAAIPGTVAVPATTAMTPAAATAAIGHCSLHVIALPGPRI